jgi:asparagine synthase (glutamine-hydrolysing)
MCGFTGYVGAPIERGNLEAARDVLRHRGPDAEGIWQERYPEFAVGLAFRRLRILDLSSAADQPMERDGLHLIFNGEIYNYRELRADLARSGHRFRSTGDTEVLLAAYQEWGLDAVSRLEGMFAFVIWDERAQRLVLARDRVGIKPLYYAQMRGRFAFASEAKALLALGVSPRLNERGLDKFLTFLWVPDPETLFEGIFKLPPGHLGVFDHGAVKIEQYWDIELHPDSGSLDEHAERLNDALRRSVARQLASDVPLGVFLSGGVDSTLLARLAAERSSRPVLTIAAGFDRRALRNEVGEDDLTFARLAAGSIPNLEYEEVVLSNVSANVVADLAESFDDPVADPAAIATYIICKAARPKATVMLSGVGAEELFAGYPRHRAVSLAGVITRLSKPVDGRMFRGAAALIPGAIPGWGMGGLRHAKKFVHGLSAAEPYVAYCSHHDGPSLSRLVGRNVDWLDVTRIHREHLAHAREMSPLSKALYLDLKTFLPCLNLAYTDRSSMASSVEVRVPMLDELVLACAGAIPDRHKLSGRRGKIVLKRAARGSVPDEIIRRRKTGFGAPVRTWMRELSGEVLRDCLSRQSIESRGLLNADEVRKMQSTLRRGWSDQALQLWAVVVLELWARQFLDKPALASNH